MNYLNSIKQNPLTVDIILLIVRVFIGFAMLSHGFPKLQLLFSEEEITFYNFIGLGQKTSLILAVFAEFVCSIFIILGLFTRFSLGFLIITMFVAAFFVHSSNIFSKRELSLLYLSVYLLLFAMGPGKYSIDHMIDRRKETSW